VILDEDLCEKGGESKVVWLWTNRK